MKTNCLDNKIRNICYRILASKAIFLCHELKLFDYLFDFPSNLYDISEHLKLDIKKTHALLSICCSEKLIKRKGRVYYITKVTEEYLYSKSPFYYGAFLNLLYIKFDKLRSYNKIKESICSNNPIPLGSKLFGTDFYSDNNLIKDFAYAMHAKSISPSKHWVEYVNFNKKKILIDVGGGLGTHSIAACEKFNYLKAYVLEKKEILIHGEKYIKDKKLENKIKFIECDIFKDPIMAGDVYFLSDILHDWDENKCYFLLDKIYKIMNKGNNLIIHEIFFNHGKTGPWQASAYNFSMNIFSEGQQYSKKDIINMLKKIGLKDIIYKKTFGDWGIIISEKS